MRLSARKLALASLLFVVVVGTNALPSSAGNERDNAFFNNSGQVCIEGINATTVLLNGKLQFQSATRSLQLNCATDRTLPYAYISTSTGLRAIDSTAGTQPYCGYFAGGIGYNSAGTARADAPYIQLTGSQIRSSSYCNIPSGHVAAAGAYSLHDAVIFGSWTQQGFVVGTVSNLI